MPSPSDAVAAAPQDEESEEWTDKLTADLDGDGSPETATVRCSAESLAVEVGGARQDFELGMSDLMGCVIQKVSLSRPGAQLWVVADEHDEVGPDTHVLLAFRGGKLRTIWQGEANVDVDDDDGTWQISESECSAEKGKLTTTVTTYRWNGKRVSERKKTSSEKVDPADCESEDDP